MNEKKNLNRNIKIAGGVQVVEMFGKQIELKKMRFLTGLFFGILDVLVLFGLVFIPAYFNFSNVIYYIIPGLIISFVVMPILMITAQSKFKTLSYTEEKQISVNAV